MMAEGLTRILIPHQAADVSAAAVNTKGEFDAEGCLTFPYLKYSDSLFGSDPRGPSSWMAHIRVFGNDEVRVPQLYIKVTNKEEQGFIRYDTATLAGGAALKLEHISYRQVDNLFNEASFWYEEHIGIVLTPAMLKKYIDKPLRIQISRPSANVQFIVEVPAHYVAGVLHRLNPDQFEIAPAPAAAVNSKEETDPMTDLGWFKKSCMAGAVVAAIAAYFVGMKGGLVAGGVALMLVSGYLTKQMKK